MFRIKICGITSIEDAQAMVEAGADAIGLNFFAPSPRYVEPMLAEAIAAILPSGVAKIGVFVNSPIDEILDLQDRLKLDMIQLHGDEPPDFLRRLGPLRIVRAIRCRDGDAAPVTEYLNQCESLGCSPEAVLIDAYQPGQFGGTGHVVEWDAAASLVATLGGMHIVLAGGLRPGNVASAIGTVRPHAVDTASGVESQPGRKDPILARRFVAAARAAFDDL